MSLKITMFLNISFIYTHDENLTNIKIHIVANYYGNFLKLNCLSTKKTFIRSKSRICSGQVLLHENSTNKNE